MQYTLYMCGGFREWEVGDDVLVEYVSRAQRRAATCASTITTSSITDAGSLAGGSLVGGASSSGGEAFAADEDLGEELHLQQTPHIDGGNAQSSAGHFSAPKLMPAVITDNSAAGGLFDIRWNDGERERGVRRNRIHRPASPCPPWTMIYRGTDCQYAVEGIVPESIVERERDFPYEVRGVPPVADGHDSKGIFCTGPRIIFKFPDGLSVVPIMASFAQVSAKFSLQTKGTEVPRDRLSRHSPVVTLQTNFEGQGPLHDARCPEKNGGAAASVKARLATAKALDGSISGSAPSSLSGLRPLHGQYVATGTGSLYL